MHRPRLFYAPFLSFLISTAFPSSAQSTANPALDTLLETSFGLGGAARLRLSPINTLSSNGHNPQLGSAFLRMGIDPGAFRKGNRYRWNQHTALAAAYRTRCPHQVPQFRE